MNQLYQTIGAGDLRTNVNDAFKMAEKGPVVVLSRTQPKAVMVNPDHWNAAAHELSVLRAIVEAMEIASRKDKTISLGDLCKELNLDPKQLITSETTGV